MKFAAVYEAYLLPQWSDKYIAYSRLKRLLKQKRTEIRNAVNGVASRPLNYIRASVLKIRELKADRLNTSSLRSIGSSSSIATTDRKPPTDQATYISSIRIKADDDFMSLLWTGIDKVETHFHQTKKVLMERLTVIEDELHAIETTYYRTDQSISMEAHKARLQRCVIGLLDVFEKLEAFVKLNMMAIYKILKKKDKMLGVSNAVGGILFYLPQCKERLAVLTLDAKSHSFIMNVYKKCLTKGEYQDLSHIEAVDAKMLIARQFKDGKPRKAGVVGFTAGVCFVLLLNIVVLCCLPATNPSYTLPNLMATAPIFRLFLMPSIMLWSTALAIYCFEEFGVNYKFLLDIDPKCEITSSTLFSIATWQTLFWVLTFAVFLVHHKFFPLSNYKNFDWCCVGALIIFQFIFWAAPHSHFRQRHRKALLHTIATTISSGIKPPNDITLVMSVVGDFFTSFSKPLCDVAFLGCYIYNSIRLRAAPSFDVFCSNVFPWLIPILMGFPFWIRLFHCYVRYKREAPVEEGGKGYIHAANMGKYFLSITVIVITAVSWGTRQEQLYRTRFIWVFAYIAATAYSFMWDIYMDWGLFPDPDAFIRTHQRTMFPHWIYFAIAFLNLIWRLTWALTLMPFIFINNTRLSAEMLILFISATEIMRRCAWIILRLENEHLTNQSRYRAMLWIPLMVDDTTTKKRSNVAALSDFDLQYALTISTLKRYDEIDGKTNSVSDD